jgi:hypothetical protein
MDNDALAPIGWITSYGLHQIAKPRKDGKDYHAHIHRNKSNQANIPVYLIMGRPIQFYIRDES